MIIGVPKEIKDNEYRVAIVPAGVDALKRDGHEVLVETSAGSGSGLYDPDYRDAGAEVVDEADEVWSRADLVLKVKEPVESEWARIREEHLLFTYFHFAASRELTDAMRETGATCVAYETVEEDGGSLPLLTPMSEVAGRMAIQEGAKYLERPEEGRGILLSGVPGVHPATVVILGGGVVGTNAAKVAAGLGARVVILDIDLDRLRYLDDIMPPNVSTLHSNPFTVLEMCREADLLIGAVLISGARAPVLVPRGYLEEMKNGAVIVDVAVDQGGCVETCRPTTHSSPTYIEEGVVHYCVTNMPGAVGRTSTYALTNVTLPYLREIANEGLLQAATKSEAIRKGINIHEGEVAHRAVAETFGYSHHPVTPGGYGG